MLHDDTKTVNICTVVSEDEEEDLTPGERLMRGLREGAALTRANDLDAESSSGEEEEEEIFQSEAETTRGSTAEAAIEPEKEKPTASRVEDDSEDKEDYCSMESVAERWRSKTATTASAPPP